MQDSMINTMKYWLNATKIDGFRVDVAWGVPYSFWNKCIPALKNIREIYLLAEADDAKLHETGFDATYTWKEFHVLNDIAAGKKNIFSLDTVLQNIEKEFMQGAQRLYFTSNHDENSWNKADYATMPGAIHTPFAVFTQTYNRTMPLIYSGQEEPVLRPLAFFEKDSIEFNKYERANFYTTLLKLRKSNSAFADNANFKRLKVNLPEKIMAYERTNGQDKVVVVLNLSNQSQQAILEGVAPASFEEVFTKQKVSGIQSLPMTAWGYQVFVKKN
jgi:glycosidase